MKRSWLFLLVTMASSGAARGAARGWGVGPAALLGAGEGTRPGRGGHRRPSIDSRRLEFIRYKPGEAIVSFATAPIKSRGLSERGLGGRKPGWASPARGFSRDVGRPGLEVPVGKGFKAVIAFPQSPLLTSVSPLSKKPC